MFNKRKVRNKDFSSVPEKRYFITVLEHVCLFVTSFFSSHGKGYMLDETEPD